MNTFSFSLFGIAIFFFLIALYTWYKTEDAGDDPVEVHGIGQTTYYDPRAYRLWSVLALACGIIVIIVGILS